MGSSSRATAKDIRKSTVSYNMQPFNHQLGGGERERERAIARRRGEKNAAPGSVYRGKHSF